MGRYGDAATTWEALRQASPSAEVVAEGRLVAAGCLADQGDLARRNHAARRVAASLRPKVSHLRQWYALADFMNGPANYLGLAIFYFRSRPSTLTHTT